MQEEHTQGARRMILTESRRLSRRAPKCTKPRIKLTFRLESNPQLPLSTLCSLHCEAKPKAFHNLTQHLQIQQCAQKHTDAPYANAKAHCRKLQKLSTSLPYYLHQSQTNPESDLHNIHEPTITALNFEKAPLNQRPPETFKKKPLHNNIHAN